ncbi:hypothetical protein A2872_02000 [Candidatus Gottesmanbacteria bacterium RIFCSPHIGHO2_01_FULL_42_12]|uniref:Methyltransferase type 11 domain-containing protein n=1 Tax=Candidatus Gottesmanbacteria bacterium RIFCSPHIGHO2_01_FULL_42_12 TaxID=1798377 RepID=A0A1F5Z5K0_9BACT|nr:MAG: hypothetical protein A2872_02000 [Candidatus Gottesmanbacteria bacterium RIFCSPHIGHO2_01_FULL_42_12]
MNKTVQNYYDYTMPYYRLFWHGKSRAVHYGIWDKYTKNLQEALLNTNRILVDLLKIKPGNKVLDAGCGVGGSSIWIAKNIKAHVTGITISNNQLRKAKSLAQKNQVSDLTDFFLMDYTKTSFPDKTFDVVFGIESVCHANPKIDFLKEAYRILKPGGKFAVVDGYLNRDPKNPKEQEWLADFYEGMALQSLDKVPDFIESAKIAGFKKVKFIDKSQEIMPSSKIIHDMCVYGYPISQVLEKLHIFPHLMTTNCKAGLTQYESMKVGMGKYGIIYGEK